jgi:hypothetical protein
MNCDGYGLLFVFQDGCWGCFDEGQSLNMQAMAVLMDHVQSIILALRAKQNFIVLVDGTEVQKKT